MHPWQSPWASTGAERAAARIAELGGGVDSDAEARARALRWVGELGGGDRAERLRSCGWMEVCFHPVTGAVSWRNRWCRDRACPGCSKRRANTLRHQLRAQLEARRAWRDDPKGIKPGSFLFVTLTHPKQNAATEGPGQATTRLLGEWRKLTKRRPFVAAVQGYVRAVECVYSRRGYDGWHAHLHAAIELHPDVPRHMAERAIVAAWVDVLVRETPADAPCSKCEGAGCIECGDAGTERERIRLQAPKAQNVQTLTVDRIGQVVKYITKPFELPDALAPTFFAEMKGRRLIAGGGTWADFHTRDADHVAAPGWVPQAAHVAELVQAAADDRPWVFRWLSTEHGIKPVCPWRAPEPDECEAAVSMPAREALARLALDCAPCHRRQPLTPEKQMPQAIASTAPASSTRQSPRAAQGPPDHEQLRAARIRLAAFRPRSQNFDRPG